MTLSNSCNNVRAVDDQVIFMMLGWQKCVGALPK